MAEHKAPTEVTIHHEERSAFAQFVDRNWLKAALLTVVVVAVIVGKQVADNRAQEARAEVWDTLGNAASPLQGGGDVEGLRAAAEQVRGTDAEPLALMTLAQVLVNEREYAEAREVVQRLRATKSDVLTREVFPVGQDGTETTLIDRLEASLVAQEQWEAERTGLFANPPLPEGSPRVRITTTQGDIVVGLYQEQAPQHVENFLKLVETKFYEGTKFHRVIRGFMIQGGDPNTKEGEVSTWGQGGPGYKVDREENDLFHYPGVLSAAKQGNETQSSGSQFFLTTGAPHHLDGRHVVYGKVLEGMDVVARIEEGEIDPTSADRPLDPVSVESMTLLPNQ